LLRGRVAQLDRDDLIELLIQHDVPVAPVNDLHEAATDPHAIARGMIYDVSGEQNRRVAEWPVALDAFASRASLTPAPAVGADSREVLADHGFSPSEIDALIGAGVVGATVEQQSA
jgi:crotonobetainyl-CoA:carnitine CoA-transferase CaiB-like acyl-CoA transferase